MIRAAILLPLSLSIAGCGNLTGPQETGFGLLPGTAYLGGTPSTEIDQVYHLAIFDPQGQLPPSLYRLRVRGQASFLSRARFASGWVPAAVADSIAGRMRLAEDADQVEVKAAMDEARAGLASGGQLMIFGPEGFREAPRNHRFVIVMAPDPEKYFTAIEQSLAVLAAATQSRSPVALDRLIFEELLQLGRERDGVTNLVRDLE